MDPKDALCGVGAKVWPGAMMAQKGQLLLPLPGQTWALSY